MLLLLPVAAALMAVVSAAAAPDGTAEASHLAASVAEIAVDSRQNASKAQPNTAIPDEAARLIEGLKQRYDLIRSLSVETVQETEFLLPIPGLDVQKVVHHTTAAFQGPHFYSKCVLTNFTPDGKRHQEIATAGLVNADYAALWERSQPRAELWWLDPNGDNADVIRRVWAKTAVADPRGTMFGVDHLLLWEKKNPLLTWEMGGEAMDGTVTLHLINTTGGVSRKLTTYQIVPAKGVTKFIIRSESGLPVREGEVQYVQRDGFWVPSEVNEQSWIIRDGQQVPKSTRNVKFVQMEINPDLDPDPFTLKALELPVNSRVAVHNKDGSIEQWRHLAEGKLEAPRNNKKQVTQWPEVKPLDPPEGHNSEWFFYPAHHPQQQELNKIVGKQAPPLQVTDWMNGQVTAEEMKGKIVVVDFWATWCGPCLAAIPHTNELAKKYADKGVVVVGVCTHSRGQDKMEEMAQQHKIEYAIARDPQSATAKAWGVQFYPTYAVVGRDGKVAAIGLRPSAVEKMVEKLLQSEAADAVEQRK